MFLEDFQVFKPCRKVFEIKDLKLGELYDQLDSRNKRSQKIEEAQQRKSEVFFQSEAFPESLRYLIDALMSGPQIVQQKLLDWIG